ncbi:hypothetical protein BCR35DRAFT_332527 [Leucosporidium creatinivorum]|uniref:MYND-type domain-containing protein n=1 Tax=Leucosporidium creatinivorum TaxID=106004 RepID=A0A1Y2F180_9BASI|nr:hypothetical protein BCR35DRAFT_332527 [Leucosporidium creatinivorum]
MATEADLARCCLNCHATAAADGGSLKACGGCRKARYCSTECQKLDRPQHKMWCGPIAQANSKIGPLSSAADHSLHLNTSSSMHSTHAFVAAIRLTDDSKVKLARSVIDMVDATRRRIHFQSAAAQPFSYVFQHLSWVGDEDCLAAMRGLVDLSRPYASRTKVEGADIYGSIASFLRESEEEDLYVLDFRVIEVDKGRQALDLEKDWLEKLRLNLGGG